MKLLLDHHYSTAIAEQLRKRDHDVVTAYERGWSEEPDETLLALCGDDGRAMLTNNVSDFTVIARAWAAEGRSHAGLLFTSDKSHPRTTAAIGLIVEDLDELLSAHPEDDAFMGRVGWLSG